MYTVYSQHDPRWANLPLGNGDYTQTIDLYGCLLCSFAMLATNLGYPVDPLILNTLFKRGGEYVKQDNLGDDALAKLGPNDWILLEDHDYTGIPADLSKLHSEPGQAAIVEIDFDHNPNDGIQTHFAPVVSWDGKTLLIADPWFGSVDDFTKHYGTNLSQTIQKIFRYRHAAPIVPIDPLVADLKTQLAASQAALAGLRAQIAASRAALVDIVSALAKVIPPA